MWYVRRQGKVQGPFSPTRMRGFAADGKLKPEFEVSRDQENWLVAEQVFECSETRATPDGNVDSGGRRAGDSAAAEASSESESQRASHSLLGCGVCAVAVIGALALIGHLTGPNGPPELRGRVDQPVRDAFWQQHKGQWVIEEPYETDSGPGLLRTWVKGAVSDDQHPIVEAYAWYDGWCILEIEYRGSRVWATGEDSACLKVGPTAFVGVRDREPGFRKHVIDTQTIEVEQVFELTFRGDVISGSSHSEVVDGEWETVEVSGKREPR